MTVPLVPDADNDQPDPDDDSTINDPGNEDPGSIEDDALVPLIEDDDALQNTRQPAP